MLVLYNIEFIDSNMRFEMPFKEKIAWISLVTTILVWGTYFVAAVRAGMTGGVPHPTVYMAGFTAALIAQAVLATIASVITAVLSPRDATAASDERDKAIAHRAYAFAYPVLLALIVCVAASVHFGATPWGLVNGMIAAIVAAEIVHYGAQIAGYRKGR
jgi:preprotein translocase subunit SecY